MWREEHSVERKKKNNKCHTDCLLNHFRLSPIHANARRKKKSPESILKGRLRKTNKNLWCLLS